MAGNGGFEADALSGGTYFDLLFADEAVNLESDAFFNPSSSSPKMLCFGDYAKESCIVNVNDVNGVEKTGTKSSVTTCSSYSDKSSTLPKSSNKKRNGVVTETMQMSEIGAGGGCPVGIQRSSKKTKSDNSTLTGHAKVKKEKLGERITALQQLVSPFGKTDTASVLHEALGYIRFLQDQVQVLCSPYMQRSPSSSSAQSSESGDDKRLEVRKGDLKSRGLCLVPLELTLHVADSNGADMWSSGAMLDRVSSNP